MSFRRKEIGAKGEEYAVRYCKRLGYRILAKNWTCRIGEIDFVAVEGRTLVIVEVKTRMDCAFAERYLFENITAQKRVTLRRLAEFYWVSQGLKAKGFRLRIDIVGVMLEGDGLQLKKLKHLRAAI